MNKWFLLLILPLCAFTMIHDKHPDFPSVDDEFNNIEDNKQDTAFRILASTPQLTDLQDHEIVLVSSNGFVSLMARDNVEIWAVRLSCVTVVR